MGVRFRDLNFRPFYNLVRPSPVILLLLLAPVLHAQKAGTEEVKKEAARLFEDDEYVKAYKLYAQLVSNFPKDPEYNYRLGVCMIYAEPDKKKCLPFLKAAAAGPDPPRELPFFLGKAYHINYRFDDALRYYNDFKKTASSSRQKKLQVDREIQACMNGRQLLSNMSGLEVLAKKQLNEGDYFRSYDLATIGGKLLVKPEDFASPADKKKKERSVVFLPRSGDVVYYSSYGEKGETGKDIYMNTRMPGGSFGKPVKVPGVNTEYDEDYPFLHPNGKTLYFASKGHNSMGGYDLFKTTFDDESGLWSAPVNLEFPINSPDDDYLFVTDSLEKTAYFSTGRQSPPGKIDVLKISTERKPIDVLVIRGTVERAEGMNTLESVITVKNSAGTPIGSYTASPEGEYSLQLPNGASLQLDVATAGMKSQSAELKLPYTERARPFKQTLTYADGKLKITNSFDAPPKEDDYLQYLAVIEDKAKLDVNEGKNLVRPPTLANDSVPLAAEKPKRESRPTLVESESDKPGNVSNRSVADLAKRDAEELRQESGQLSRDAKAATETGERQKADAEARIREAESQRVAAGEISDTTERREAIDKADEQIKRAKEDVAIAEKILSLSKQLEEDALQREKEAQLNDEYAAELEKGATDNQSVARLEELQKKINASSGSRKEPAGKVTAIQNELAEKEKDLEAAQRILTESSNRLAEVRSQITSKETELANTRKKSKKEAIGNEITQLRGEETSIAEEIRANETQTATLRDEIGSLRAELGKVATARIESRPAVTPTVSAPASSPVPVAARPPGTSSELRTKYTPAIVANPVTFEQAQKNIEALAAYNKDIESSLAAANTALPSAKTPAEKQRLQKEISSLNSAKTQNEAALVKAEKVAAESGPDVFQPIPADNPSVAANQIQRLARSLEKSEAPPSAPVYNNPEAATLRSEGDEQLKESQERRAELSRQLVEAGEALKSSPASPETLTREAEETLSRAQQLKKDAALKPGTEKDAILAEAASLEEEGNGKLLRASEISGKRNEAQYTVNSENIAALLASGKAPANESDEARKLSDEAAIAFKQAADIRKEAGSLATTGAMLGSMSNAEEREAEAVLKQQQAIEILRRTNPDVSLKTPAADTAVAGRQDPGATIARVNEQLSGYTTGVLEGLDKVYRANRLELDFQKVSVDSSLDRINATPALKTAYLLANKSSDKSVADKTRSDNSPRNDAKISALRTAIAGQDEALVKYREVAGALKKLPPAVATTESKPAVTPAENRPPAATKTPADNEKEVSAGTIDVSAYSANANPEGVISAIDNAKVAYTDPAAGQQIRTSLQKLRALSTGGQPPSADLPVPQLREQVTQLQEQGEQLSSDAFALRQQANGKEGAERESMLARAKETENASQEKMLQAAELTARANEKETARNDAVISAYSAKLQESGGALTEEQEAQAAAIGELAVHAINLREESRAQANAAARLGSMMNAEEKEAELLEKQKSLLSQLAAQMPDFKPEIPEEAPAPSGAPGGDSLLSASNAELNTLIGALHTEYESSSAKLPAQLSGQKQKQKERAGELNRESKRLAAEALNESEPRERSKKLSVAARVANAAVEQLAAASAAPAKPDKDAETLASIGQRINGGTPERNTAPAKTKAPAPARASRGVVKVEGLEVIPGNAYSAAKPIPFDAAMPDGLIFRVQIGAFRNKLTDNAFKGLSPLSGETTTSGYFRYTAGNFNRIETANGVKNDLRGLGYNDAFVVAYYNGKRISLAEAMGILTKEGRAIDATAAVTAGITESANIPRAANNAAIQEPVEVAKELEQTNGLLYTIQVGVYNRQVSKQRLLNLRPIFTEKLDNGRLRYTAGIYSDAEKLLTDRKKVVDMGLRDAFVSAYINGKRVGFAEARQRQQSDPSIRTEAENPIVFPPAGILPGLPAPAPPVVQPFTNNVKSYPAATPENGVKNTEEGVCFKVQIGAFSRQVPAETAAKFSAIRTWPVEYKQVNGLFIYNIGNFSEARFAKTLKDEAVRAGITDAFVSVYRDGRKVTGSEAAALLSR